MTTPTMTRTRALKIIFGHTVPDRVEYDAAHQWLANELDRLQAIEADHDRLTATVAHSLFTAQQYIPAVIGILEQVEGGAEVIESVRTAMAVIEIQANTGKIKTYRDLQDTLRRRQEDNDQLTDTLHNMTALVAQRDIEIARLRAAITAYLEGDGDGVERLRAALEGKSS